MKKNHSSSKQLFLSIVVVLSSIVFSILLLESALSWYSKTIAQSSKMDLGLMEYHHELGWSLTSNWLGKHDHYDFEVNYSTNSYGNRTQPDFLNKKNKIAIIGDSFTFGYGVNDSETFSNLLNKKKPNTSTYNFGVPGYSTDQEYLLIKKLLNEKSFQQFVLVFYLGNDLLDNALPHPLQAEPAKPYYKVVNDKLALRNVPVPKVRKSAQLRKHSLNSLVFGEALIQQEDDELLSNLLPNSSIIKWLYPKNIANPNLDVDTILDESLQNQKELLRHLIVAMQDAVLSKQADFSIVLMPGSSFVNLEKSYSYEFQNYVRKFILEMSGNRNINVIDLANILFNKPLKIKRTLFHPNEGHLTAKGHKVVSEILFRELIN